MTDDRTELKTVEDLEIDQSWDVGDVTISEAEILSFAKQYDPQQFHVDPEAAKRHFDGLIASGWHTAAACMRPFVTEVLSGIAVVAALGTDDLRWHVPVKPGDTLSVAVTVRNKEPWNQHRGKVTFGLRATNQDDETVHTREDLVLVERAERAEPR